jgi:hypothetical protein
MPQRRKATASARARKRSSRAAREVVRDRRNTDLLQRTPHHASAAETVSAAGPGWRNRNRGDRV